MNPGRDQSEREWEAQRSAEEHAAERTRWRAQEEHLCARIRALESDKHSSRTLESDKHSSRTLEADKPSSRAGGARKNGAVAGGLEVDYVRIKDKLSELQTRLSKEGLRAAKVPPFELIESWRFVSSPSLA